ncbi:uroporphyrinogen decarboxylase family protein [Azotosporobacter soli]|uniref:uroporphyrinogen decarboxylase family protein n=1 Tax=Azotosporobacter soli TaxID=3055040 RepID=UPI0031FF2FC8
MITGMERLAAAVQGKRSDRIPVFCNLLDQGAKELGMPLQEYYSKGEYVAEAQLRMREKYGYDSLWSLFYVGKEAELLGCRKIIFASNGPPNVGEMIIKSHKDIEKLEIPEDIAAQPAFAESLKCLQILKKEAGGKYPICAYVTSSMTLPAILMGMDKWMDLLLTGPVEVRDMMLEKCSEFFRREIAAYRAAGANVLVYSNPFGSTDFVPMKLFQDISLAWMEKDLKPGGMDGVVYYCGGARMNSVIEQVISTLGISAYYLSPLDDIAEGKKIIAGRALCGGVINDIKLIDWSRAEIRMEVKRMMEAGMAGGKFLFGTLVMPYSIPEDNIKTLVEAAYEFGSYGR